MADNGTNAAQLPPPPQSNQGAPGYENGQKPPPPLHIPQNNNPIPTAITSPLSGVDQALSPGSAGGFGRRAAPEPNKRALYIGGLDQRVTEDVLRQIFETTGHVQNVKIIPDKNVSFTSRVLAHDAQLTRFFSKRATTTVSSSTTILVRPSALCRP